MKCLAIAFSVAYLLAGCQTGRYAGQNGRQIDSLAEAPPPRDYIEALGTAAADSALLSASQRRVAAREVAVKRARDEMLTVVENSELTNGITIRRAVETNPPLKLKIQEIIAAAAVNSSEFTAEDGCVASIRVLKKQLEDSLGITLR